MKGTLISTDFVKDSSGGYKFLEINTDAGMSKDFIENYLDLSPLHTIIDEHTTTIDTFEVVYKPLIHSDFVEALSQSISDNVSSITSFVKHEETLDAIYPTSPDDDESKFILRLAYDENAILDSIYAKNNLSSLRLFNENTSSNAIPFWFSSSIDGEDVFIDSLNRETNSSNLPDLVMKSTAQQSSVAFLKLKNGSTDEEKVNLLLSESTDRIVTNFEIHNDSITDGVAQSVKHYSIVYGGTLSTINIGTYNTQAMLSLPSSIEINDTQFTNADAVNQKHFYEFSTTIKKEQHLQGDLFETERIISSSGDPISMDDLETGSLVQSYYINGLPDTGELNDFMGWEQSGYSFASGSEPTSSVIESFATFSMASNELVQIKVTGDDEYRYIPTSAKLLVYDSGSDTTKFKPATQVKNSSDYLVSATGSLISIDESYMIFLSTATGSTYNVNVETADILVTDGSTIGGLGFILHNITCFAAGTQISLANGDTKNIEDIVVGDEVLGWDGNSIESSVVSAIDHRHTVGGHGDACKTLGDEPSLYTINDTGIEFTPEHPFLTKDGWKSLVPNPNDEPYKSIQEPKVLSVGDSILRDGNWEEINTIGIVRSDSEERVYNITVEKLHSYIANGIVVHNKNFT
jgi:hypothetical protein